MTEKYENNYLGENPVENNNSNSKNIEENQNVSSESLQTKAENSAGATDKADEASTQRNESSYEWNSDGNSSNNSNSNSYDSNGIKNGEYHYSYVNGNNDNAPHNPNNYNNEYSKTYDAPNSNSSSTEQRAYANNDYSGTYGANGYQNYGASSSNAYSTNNYSSANQGYSNPQDAHNYSYGYNPNSSYQATHYSANNTYSADANVKNAKAKKQKKPSKPASRKFVAAMLAVAILASSLIGFGGGYVFSKINRTQKGSLNITQVEPSEKTDGTNASTGVTSQIVKKTADSVVEIVTESVVTGSFARQYVQQGAGSGVIISDDGYIITNYHVIEGANNVTVTLRDGKTEYTAAIIGSDEENDIALLKIDANKLSPATFGDSSNLAVGDYVVAIGNPLGELGGTVTDGIISALAREVTIEDQNMTLLQTNAQISPGNSGGGLFNSAGELVGIVNAKDSATEVEGIAFAIPINTVLDIINDLREYGYVTGKIELGMELMDINSKETAFYYGVNQTGCYVLSVTKNSNADTAGFNTGDLITKVDGTKVTTTEDVEKAIEDNKVGDKVTFTVYRSGKSMNIDLVLAEYTPSGKTYENEQSQQFYQGSDDFWSQIFGW